MLSICTLEGVYDTDFHRGRVDVSQSVSDYYLLDVQNEIFVDVWQTSGRALQIHIWQRSARVQIDVQDTDSLVPPWALCQTSARALKRPPVSRDEVIISSLPKRALSSTPVAGKQNRERKKQDGLGANTQICVGVEGWADESSDLQQ